MDYTVKLTDGILADTYRRATDYFLHKIDVNIHASAYVGEHEDMFAETEFAGKYLDTCVRYAQTAESEEDRRTALDHARTVKDAILANQRGDGYIGGLPAGKEWNCFSVWNQAFTVIGLVAYARVTKDKDALGAACRSAEFVMEHYTHSPAAHFFDSLNLGTQHLAILVALTNLYAETKKERHAEYIRYIVRILHDSDLNFLEAEDILQLRSRKGIENFLALLGLLEYGDLFDDPAALTGCVRYWEQLKAGQIRKNGNGTLFECWYEGGNEPKKLPVQLKPNENCVAVGWMEFSAALYERTGESRYMDAIEQTFYNHLLGAIGENGADFAYYQPNFGKRITATEQSMYKCCRYRGYSAISHLPEMLFERSGDTVTFRFYGGAVYEDEGIRIEESASYPFGTGVRFTVTAKAPCTRTLRLRVPAAVQGARLASGAEEIGKMENGYLTFTRDFTETPTAFALSFDIPLSTEDAEIDGVTCRSYTYGTVLLAAEWKDEDGEPTVSRTPVKPDAGTAYSHIAFRVGDVTLVDYAASGRTPGTSFSVWLPAEG